MRAVGTGLNCAGARRCIAGIPRRAVALGAVIHQIPVRVAVLGRIAGDALASGRAVGTGLGRRRRRSFAEENAPKGIYPYRCFKSPGASSDDYLPLRLVGSELLAELIIEMRGGGWGDKQHAIERLGSARGKFHLGGEKVPSAYRFFAVLRELRVGATGLIAAEIYRLAVAENAEAVRGIVNVDPIAARGRGLAESCHRERAGAGNRLRDFHALHREGIARPAAAPIAHYNGNQDH